MDPSGPSDGAPPGIDDREKELLSVVNRDLIGGRIAEASKVYSGSLANSNRLGAEEYERILQSLLVGQKRRGFSRTGITLYGQILWDMVLQGEALADLPRPLPSLAPPCAHPRRG